MTRTADGKGGAIIDPIMNQEREAVARLIEPHIWSKEVGDYFGRQAEEFREATLAKADQIIALLRSGGEGWRPDEDWLDEVEDFLDDYSDAEIIDGTTHPNKAMRLLCQLREGHS